MGWSMGWILGQQKGRCSRTGPDLHFPWWRGVPVTAKLKASAAPYVLVDGLA
jgi:hypothetical protein